MCDFLDNRLLSYQYLNLPMVENLQRKFLSFAETRDAHIDESYVIVVYSNGRRRSKEIWSNMFDPYGIMYHIKKRLPLIPLPDNYLPAQYDQYAYELRDYVEGMLMHIELIGNVFDLGTKEAPEMNLLLADRKLTQMELIALGVPQHYLGGGVAIPVLEERSTGTSSPDLSENDLEVSQFFGPGNPAELLRMEIFSTTIVDLPDANSEDEPANSRDEKSDEPSREVAFLGPEGEGQAPGKSTGGYRSNEGEEFRQSSKTPLTRKNSTSSNEESDEPNRRIDKYDCGVAGLALGNGTNGHGSNDDAESRPSLWTPFSEKNSSSLGKESDEPNQEVDELETGVAGQALEDPNLTHVQRLLRRTRIIN